MWNELLKTVVLMVAAELLRKSTVNSSKEALKVIQDRLEKKRLEVIARRKNHG